MATIRKLASGKQQIRYRDNDGIQRAETLALLKDARARKIEIESSLSTGAYVDPRAGRVSLREFAAEWEATLIHRAATANIVDNAMRLHLLPALGDRKMTAVKRSDIQGFVKRLSEELAPGTVRNIADQTARLLASAVEDHVIAETPYRKITLPALSDDEVVPPTLAEVTALADEVPGRYRAVVVLLAGSGLRIGEALGLRVSDVNFLRREVRVDRQRLQNGAIAPPKTSRSIRTVPLGTVVLEALAAHLAAYGTGSEWLFTTGSGEPLGYRSWRTVWDGAQRPERMTLLALPCPKCGAAPTIVCLNSSGTRAARPHAARVDQAMAYQSHDTHALRHFFASSLISGGASVKTVSTLLGHSSPVITLRVYAHLFPGDEDRARVLVDAALSGLTRVA